jgi:hypothetical protein
VKRVKPTYNGRNKEKRPRKRWRDKVEWGLNIMINTGRQWPATVLNGGRVYWKLGPQGTVVFNNNSNKGTIHND